MPTGDSVVLYQANGDSIAGANSFPALLQQAHNALNSDTDTSGMCVTFAEPNGIRAMTLQRALRDYLPEGDRKRAVDQLKAHAAASKKLASWLQAQEVAPAEEPAAPVIPEGVTGPSGFVPTKAGKAEGL
jgi:hypothetical protein